MNERDSIRAALAHIPAHDRDLWVRMGMAIKSTLGEDGFNLWAEWSEQDESWNERDGRDVWRSLRANGRVTIGTLYHEAKRYGFKGTIPASIERITHAPPAANEDTSRAKAASKAAALWKAAHPLTDDHPYLSKKNVKPVSTLREISASKAAEILGYVPNAKGEPLTGRLIVVPIKVNGRLSTLELIDGQGRKAALSGGAKASGYWAAQKLPDSDGHGETLVIGEGVATVLSAKEATGHFGVAALSCGNLAHVANAMREQYPAAMIVILADLGNGQSKAEQVARAVDGLVAVPNFGDDRPEGATDFNDLARYRGSEAVRACIANAKAPARNEVETSSATAPAGIKDGRISYQRASDIEAQPIRWLWPGRIARSKVSVLAGHPGLGKSQITASMAAIASTGGLWPVDRTPCERGNVVILSAEDDLADTIRPRLEAAGADLSRVIILDGLVRHADGSGRAISLKADIDHLGATLTEIGDVALVVIDPITAYLGDADSHKNAEIRGLLAPLADLAAKHETAIVCVSHLNKSGGSDALMRVMGSLAFVAGPRAAFLVAKDNNNETRRLFLPMKNNLSNDRTGLAFTVQSAQVNSTAGVIDTSRVMWDAAPMTVTADEVMNPLGDPEERSALEDAMSFLQEVLKHGAVPSKQVREEAEETGHSWRTIRRAQRELNIQVRKAGMNGPWQWRLPAKVSKACEDGQAKTLDTFGHVGHLREIKPDDDAEVFEVEE